MQYTILAVLLGTTASAQAQVQDIVANAKGDVGYVIDQRAVVARSGTGLCWRTGYWTPAMAIAECDPDLVKKEVPPPPQTKTEAKPETKPAPPVAKTISLSSKALFDFNKAILTTEGKATLDKEIVAKLNDIKKITFMLVTGHTDRLGSHSYNQKLSEKRAEAVKGYLVTKGIDANVVETMGAGKTQPVPGVSCNDKLPRKKLIECLAPNRRVVVEVKGDPK